MKPFFESERENLQRADKALELAERKLRIMNDPHTPPITAIKLSGQVQKHMQEYEQAKADLLKGWASEEKPTGERVDMVTIAEDHNWHPHESF